MQELNLGPDQKLALQARLKANDTDANRYYLYDYYQKNCATMVRDQIDLATDGAVHRSLEKVPTGTTYRYHNSRLSAEQLWLFTFLYYSLGHFVDQPISAWQESFLPGKFAGHLRTIRIKGLDGAEYPLVSQEKPISASNFPERETPPNQWLKFSGGAAVFALALLALAELGRRHWTGRWLFNLLGMVWSLLAGLMGALLTYAWFSNHTAAKWNENWMPGNPLSLLLVLLLPLAWKWPRLVLGLSTVVLLIACADLLAKLTPIGWQSNGLILVFAIPAHVAIAAGVWRISTRPKPSGIAPISHPGGVA